MRSFGILPTLHKISTKKRCLSGLHCSENLKSRKLPGSVPGAKRQGRGVECPPLSSADIRDKWRYTSVLSMCLQGVDKAKLYLLHSSVPAAQPFHFRTQTDPDAETSFSFLNPLGY